MAIQHATSKQATRQYFSKDSLGAKGYRMPAEWERHRATWLGFPYNPKDWPGKFVPIRWVFAEIIKYIVRDEKVSLVVASAEHEHLAKSVLTKSHVPLENVEFFRVKTDRGWMRDCMPNFVKNTKKPHDVIAAKYHFNGWAKYDNYKLDTALPRALAKKLQWNLHEVTVKNKPFVLEGGSIDVNGAGTVMTTEECLLDPHIQPRNSHLTKEEIEQGLKDNLGVTNVLWLGKGIAGDDTHGHIDDLCRFVNRSTVVLVQEKNAQDENYHLLQENKERLQDMRLENGEKIEVIDLPMPSALRFDGMRLPASYANFYVCNHAVLMPTFNDPNDRIALGILSELFPDRPVVGIHAVDLVWGLGTLHCLSHEEPMAGLPMA